MPPTPATSASRRSGGPAARRHGWPGAGSRECTRSPASPGCTWPGTPGSWTTRGCPRPARPASSPPSRAGTPGWPGAGTSPPARPPASPGPGPARTPRPRPGLTPDQALALMRAADTAPGPQRARTAALMAVLLFTGARLSEVIGADVGDLGTSGAPGAVGHPRQRPPPGPAAARPGRIPDRRLPRRPPGPAGRPRAVRHRDRQTAVRRRRAADRAPPRHPGRPARRPGPPPRAPHDPAVLRHAVPPGRRIAPRLHHATGHADPRTTRQ